MSQEKKDTPEVGELIEDAFLLGVGLLAITREKLTEVGEELMERGRKVRAETPKPAPGTAERPQPRRPGAHEAADADEVEALRREVADLRERLRESAPPASGDADFVP